MSEPTGREELHPDQGEETDPNEAAIAWAEEIRSRVDDVREGRVKLIPGDVVHAEAEALLARLRSAHIWPAPGSG